jgi:hypothetical protein
MPRGSASPPPATGPVVIDSTVGAVFTPTSPPPGSDGAAVYEKFTGKDTMPAGTTAQYGRLTWPTSAALPGQRREYVYRNRPVWA